MTKKQTTKQPKAPSVAVRPGEATVQEPPDAGFAIVGLGASAGGLEAFELFFRSIAPDSGMAFVLVPHLDPSHASILTEILQRSTAMPIDVFLRSLAEDQGDNAICIILSGTGTDGTLGLRAILGAGGISLVQTPETAKYDGMPASAIHGGYATHVLPVEQMPQLLRAVARRLPIRTEPTGTTVQPAPPAIRGSLDRILMLLRSATGHDFSLYKKSTIGRSLYELGNRQWGIPALRELPEHILPNSHSFDG
jgi:two-component system CheB/CheR fusion protein